EPTRPFCPCYCVAKPRGSAPSLGGTPTCIAVIPSLRLLLAARPGGVFAAVARRIYGRCAAAEPDPLAGQTRRTMNDPEEPWLRVAILSAIGGFLAFWAPWHIAGSPKNMIDGMQPISLLLLVVVGLAAGIMAPRHSWVSGLATMSLFPIVAIV